MVMVCKEDNLTFLRNIPQYFKPSASSVVVKCRKEIINYQWQCIARLLNVVFDASASQCKVQLVRRAFTQAFFRDCTSIVTERKERNIVLVDFNLEP